MTQNPQQIGTVSDIKMDNVRQSVNANSSSRTRPTALTLFLGGILLCLCAPQTAQAMPPLQLLRMYSSQNMAPNFASLQEEENMPARSRHILSRKLRELSNAFLAEEGARIHQLDQLASPALEKRAEFEVTPDDDGHTRGRDLLMHPEELQKEMLPEMEDEDSAVLAAAAAAGLLRQERNEPNVAAPKMYARHIGDLGGTMFRFG